MIFTQIKAPSLWVTYYNKFKLIINYIYIYIYIYNKIKLILSSQKPRGFGQKEPHHMNNS